MLILTEQTRRHKMRAAWRIIRDRTRHILMALQDVDTLIVTTLMALERAARTLDATMADVRKNPLGAESIVLTSAFAASAVRSGICCAFHNHRPATMTIRTFDSTTEAVCASCRIVFGASTIYQADPVGAAA